METSIKRTSIRLNMEWLSIIRVLVLSLGFIGMMTGCFLIEDKTVSSGRKLFNYYCADCHGKSGMGNGYNSDFLDPEPRDLTDSEDKYLAGFTNEEIFETLNRDFETAIPGRFIPVTMPTFKNTLSEAELWSIVAYVRTLHPNDAPKIVITPEMKGKRPRFPRIRKVDLNPHTLNNDKQVKSGESLFKKTYGCIACHSVGSEGGRIGPPLDRAGFISNPDYLYRWTKNPQAFKPHTKMPNLGVTDEDALALVAYLSTLRAPAPAMAAAKGAPVHIIQWRASWEKDIAMGYQDVEHAYPNYNIDGYPMMMGRPKAVYPISDFPNEARVFMPGLSVGNSLSDPNVTLSVEELNAEGFGTLTVQEKQNSKGKGVWDYAYWKIVILKPLNSGDIADTVITPGKTVPLAVAVWDGGNNNRGGRKNFSEGGWIKVNIE